ncbi:hypothetical protein NA57DRAFT_52982 [Rhizodiscina lignyota]|uniref:Uncharacterized protein n=1 Tax=Rhizodiscina lignyota TaxID=1504668 RepID=A0A9P4MFE4_9PEZI|nr:hypothetical protein NA57DRAFT_52982 [Rhizodiscina lignyota]
MNRKYAEAAEGYLEIWNAAEGVFPNEIRFIALRGLLKVFATDSTAVPVPFNTLCDYIAKAKRNARPGDRLDLLGTKITADEVAETVQKNPSSNQEVEWKHGFDWSQDFIDAGKDWMRLANLVWTVKESSEAELQS